MHVKMEPSKTRQTKWEQHHDTFTPSLHLAPFCLVLVCVHMAALASVATAHVHVDVHGGISCVVGCCNAIATEHGSFVCRNCGVHKRCRVCMEQNISCMQEGW